MTLARMIQAWVACADHATRERLDQNTIAKYMTKARVTHELLEAIELRDTPREVIAWTAAGRSSRLSPDKRP